MWQVWARFCFHGSTLQVKWFPEEVELSGDTKILIQPCKMAQTSQWNSLMRKLLFTQVRVFMLNFSPSVTGSLITCCRSHCSYPPQDFQPLIQWSQEKRKKKKKENEEKKPPETLETKLSIAVWGLLKHLFHKKLWCSGNTPGFRRKHNTLWWDLWGIVWGLACSGEHSHFSVTCNRL